MEDLNKLRDIDALKITLASPDDVLSWSYGEVTKPETINYRTFKPEKDGLFCEKIFGPVKDYECYCGKYKRIRYKGVVCDRCGVQVTTSKVRRERMGHIKLASPVAHVWFFKNIPSVLANVLGIAPRSLELVIYFSSFIVTVIDQEAKEGVFEQFEDKILEARNLVHEKVELKIKAILDEAEGKVASLDVHPQDKWEKTLLDKAFRIRQKANEKASEARSQELPEQEKAELELKKIEKKLHEVELHTVMTDKEYISLEEYLDEFCEVSIGAEAIQKILSEFDIQKVASDLREELSHAKSTKAEKIKKRLKTIDSFIKGNVNPASTIITILAVIPPDLRPMVQLEGGRFATSDLNDLYRRIINRNNRLKRLMELGAPEIIVRNEKRMLQEAVDALIDASKVRKSRTRDRKTYRSLADSIKGKQGHFRSNLLGKRVDYSGRAVIVSGPNLQLDECGLPTEMALELFKPFLIREIMERGFAPNMKTAKSVLEEKPGEVYSILEELVAKRPVLLNRAPTLHRLSIQAFWPKLTNGKAIQLHPVVCAGFNADFDGDQMAVHLPLSEKAVNEAIELMLASNNLLKPADGSVVTIPSKEMVLGLYYMTTVDKGLPEPKTIFADREEVLRAYGNRAVNLRQKIRVMVSGKIVETTAGLVILNKVIPLEFGYFNKALGKSGVKNLIQDSLDLTGIAKTVKLIDDLKYYGFRFSTLSGISLSIFDCEKPSDMDAVLKSAHLEIAQIEQNYHMGLITQGEMSKMSHKAWQGVTDHFDETIIGAMDDENPVKIIIAAGAGKASPAQMRQISAIKGLIADPSGRLIDMPVLGNHAIGMSSFDYFLAGRGTRRNYMDKGLGTADAGYLTRRLVNIAQDVMVRTEDCKTKSARTIRRGQDIPLHQWYLRLIGRYCAEDVKVGSKVIVKRNAIITKEIAEEINKSKIDTVKIRSALTCDAMYGVCSKCYGTDLSTNKDVLVGAAVGIIAAQSIGEPGTQLTMRTFHSGGIAAKNITQGLPRIEELFEARKPKAQAVMSSISGKVVIDQGDVTKITIIPTKKDEEEESFVVEKSMEIIVSDGDLVVPGTKLTEGALNLQDMYEALGSMPVQLYALEEVQQVYGSQGVAINDKHVEVIIRQMFNRVRIKMQGDTTLLPGDIVSVFKLISENREVKAKDGTPAEGKPVLLGISKASRMSESWLDAASFEETSGVLTESAISGKIDYLIGLKENVIIGRRIPVGEAARIDNLCQQ